MTNINGSSRLTLKKSEKETLRSVLLIVVDALNASHMGIYGYEKNTTNHIDNLAKDGIVLTDWISNSSWTRPSFTTILTGVPKAVHGMELSDHKLPGKVDTLANKFKQKNFVTAAFIGNPLIQRKWGYHRGFDVFKDTATLGDFPDADKIVNETIEWLNTVKDTLFFGVLFVTDPHAPYQAPLPAQHFSKNLTDYIKAPEREIHDGLPPDDIAKIVAAYDDEVRYADAEIGRLFEWMKKNGLFDSTTIVVTADHGEIFGEHNCFQHAYHMWEPVLRVPLILHSADVLEKGVFQIAATHVDLMPTLLDVAGMTIISGYGRSIFSEETDGGRESEENGRPIRSAYDARGVKRQAVRLGTLKLIRYEKLKKKLLNGKKGIPFNLEKNPSLEIPGPRYELFDIENDPVEQTNIYSSTKRTRELELLKKAAKYEPPVLRKRLKKRRHCLDSETLDALRAAGYIE